jgi:hypothetical protein
VSLSERLAILIDVNGAAAAGELRKVGDAAERELGKAEDRSQRMGAKFQTVGIGMIATAATIGAGLYSAGKSAAELEQTVGGTEAVFASSAGVIDTWAKGADTAAGLSEQAARKLTTQIGGALQGLGFAQDQAAEKSIELTQIGADLAATYGGTTADAVQALGSALRGEFDPMEQFNVFLKQSEIDAKAVELGLAKNTTEVDKNARAQATLALITDQSAAAQGQFAREADTSAGKAAIAEAKSQNLTDALGTGFLPVMDKVTGAVGGGAQKFLELDESMGGGASTALAYGTITLGAAGAVSTLVGWIIKLKKDVTDAFSAMKDASGGAAGLTRNVAAGGAAFAAGATAISLWVSRMNDAQAAADSLGDKIDNATSSAGSFEQLNRIMDETHRQTLGLAQQAGSVRSPLDLDYGMELLKGADAGKQALLAQAELAREVDNYANANRVSVEVAYQEVMAKKKAEQATADKAAADAEATAGMTEAERKTYEMNQAIEETAKAYADAWKAQDQFWHPGFDLDDASIKAQEAHQNLSDALAENGATLDLSTEAGRRNRSEFTDGAKAAIEYGQKILEAGGSTEDATAAVLGHVQGLRDQLIAAGLSRTAVDLYIAALKLTPDQVATQFNTPGLAQANADVAALEAALKRIQSGQSTIAFAVGAQVGAGRATGGSAMPNSVHPVGERGTEVVSTPTGSVLVMGNEGGSVRPVEPRSVPSAPQVIQLVVDGRVLAQVLNDYNLGLN